MSDRTRIEWTDATWNPITGCSVVSAGCQHCYAMRLAGSRLQHHPSRVGLTRMTRAGPVWNGQVRLNHEWLAHPIRWQRQRRIFVCAHGDLFHEAVPEHWIDTVFGIMWACLYNRTASGAGHVFQVLTKRAERMHAYLSTDRREAWAKAAVNYGGGADPDGLFDQTMQHAGPHPRIWLGVSVENQNAADERIPLLLATPAAVRWVSAEPLLGPVSLRWLATWNGQALRPREWGQATNDHDGLRRLDWVVAGGESGTGARPLHPDWARTLREQCAVAGVPFLFKQWGGWRPIDQGQGDWYASLYRSNRKARDGESQNAIDDVHGRTCTVPQLCLRIDGAHCGSTDAGAWRQGTSPILAFHVGKKSAGRELDGVQHHGYPEVEHA
jgi:protein gp37